MRRFFVVAVMLLFSGLLIVIPTEIASATAPESFDSDKWAGYAVSVEKFSTEHASVGGTWVVPEVNCKKTGSSKSAIWVGLGGTASSPDTELEQIGTMSNCLGRKKTEYVGVYEMHNRPNWGSARFLDKNEYPLKAGDKVQASVGYFGSKTGGKENGNYILTLRNLTQGWYFLQQEKGSTALSAHDTAEWIVEAPSTAGYITPLANFGKVTFINCSANGKSIKPWPKLKIHLTQPSYRNVRKARTSDLSSDGKSFTVTWSSF